jgi:hypothetical protein
MKTTPIELRPAASREAMKAMKHGMITLTRGGKPIAYVLPTAIYDEEDIGYMTDPAFWEMIRERRNEPGPGIPLEEVLARLERDEREEKKAGAPRAGKGKSSRNGVKGK